MPAHLLREVENLKKDILALGALAEQAVRIGEVRVDPQGGFEGLDRLAPAVLQEGNLTKQGIAYRVVGGEFDDLAEFFGRCGQLAGLHK